MTCNHNLPDVEYARLDTMWQELVRERDAAVAKATTYERDWYDAKSEFGTATAKLRERVRVVERERDELKARSYTFRGGYIEDAAGDRWWSADLLSRVERERDELKTRLAHAEADAEQAIHNEAFNERMKIVAWIRARVAHLTLDSRTTMQALDALRTVANEIERGEHER